MKEVIPVEIISPTQAKEVNLFDRPEMGRDKIYSSFDTSIESIMYHERWHERLSKWQTAESQRRVFEIDDCIKYCFPCDHKNRGCEVIGSIHTAEVIEGNKCIIV